MLCVAVLTVEVCFGMVKPAAGKRAISPEMLGQHWRAQAISEQSRSKDVWQWSLPGQAQVFQQRGRRRLLKALLVIALEQMRPECRLLARFRSVPQRCQPTNVKRGDMAEPEINGICGEDSPSINTRSGQLVSMTDRGVSKDVDHSFVRGNQLDWLRRAASCAESSAESSALSSMPAERSTSAVDDSSPQAAEMNALMKHARRDALVLAHALHRLNHSTWLTEEWKGKMDHMISDKLRDQLWDKAKARAAQNDVSRTSARTGIKQLGDHLQSVSKQGTTSALTDAISHEVSFLDKEVSFMDVREESVGMMRTASDFAREASFSIAREASFPRNASFGIWLTASNFEPRNPFRAAKRKKEESVAPTHADLSAWMESEHKPSDPSVHPQLML